MKRMKEKKKETVGEKNEEAGVDAQPWLEWKTVVVGLRSTTRRGDTPARMMPIEGPSQLTSACGLCGVGLPLEVW